MLRVMQGGAISKGTNILILILYRSLGLGSLLLPELSQPLSKVAEHHKIRDDPHMHEHHPGHRRKQIIENESQPLRGRDPRIQDMQDHHGSQTPRHYYSLIEFDYEVEEGVYLAGGGLKYRQGGDYVCRLQEGDGLPGQQVVEGHYTEVL
jgi:hypothetical protein